MLKEIVVISFFIFYCQATPLYHRLRRASENELKYGPCKNTYEQCPEWKGRGMCTSDEYKDYMMTVCPVTCEFCRESEGGEYVASFSPDSAASSQSTSKSTSAEISIVPEAAEFTSNSAPAASTDITQSNNSPAASTEPQVTLVEHTDQTSLDSSSVPQTQPVQSAVTSEGQQSTTVVDNRDNVNIDSSKQQQQQQQSEDYQTMLKKYYENIQQQQENYQKNIEQSYPGYQTSPSGVTASETTSDLGTVTVQFPTVPLSAAPPPPPPVALSPVQAPAPVAPSAQTTSNSQQQQQQTGASLPANVPNPIAAATNQNTSPNIVNSNPDSEQYDPTKTSSALYKNSTQKQSEDSSDKQRPTKTKEQNKLIDSTDSNEDSDEATNEKVKTESKHIEQNIKNAKQKRISAEKTLRQKAAMNLRKDKQGKETSLMKSIKDSTEENDDDDEDDDDDDGEPEEDLQGYDSKRTNLTIPSPSVIQAASEAINDRSVIVSDEGGEASGESSDTEDTSEEGSGSGDIGAIEDDLNELNMLMSLNYNDDSDFESYEDDITTAAENKALFSNNHDVLDGKKKISRDHIEVADTHNNAKDETDSSEESGSGEMETTDQNSGSGTGEDENKTTEENQVSTKETITQNGENASTNENEANEGTVEENESGQASGQSESEPESEEEGVDEEGSARDEEAEPLQNESQKLEKKGKGSISLVLRQNYQGTYKNHETPSFQMLSGNVKKDFEKVLKGVHVNDIEFSEANIEGNPRQYGKTKVTFNLEGGDQTIMKKLTKLVDAGSINGLSVFSGSLEFDE